MTSTNRRNSAFVPVFDSCTAPWTALLNHLIAAQEDRRRSNPKGLASEGSGEGVRHSLGESERVAQTPTRLDAKSAPEPGSNRVDGAYCPSRRLAWRCTSRHSPSSSRKTCVTLFDHCVGRSILATRALKVSISVV